LSICLGSKQAIFLATGHNAPYPYFKPLHRKLIFWPRPKLRWMDHGSRRFQACRAYLFYISHLLAFRFSWLGPGIFVHLFCGMLKCQKMG
jgi:hypothetical protein